MIKREKQWSVKQEAREDLLRAIPPNGGKIGIFLFPFHNYTFTMIYNKQMASPSLLNGLPQRDAQFEEISSFVFSSKTLLIIGIK